MNDLRLALVGLGILVVAGVWLWSVYARRRRDQPRVRPGVPGARGAGRRRGEAGRRPERGARATPRRPQRGENLALDLGIDREVGSGDPEPPLGLDPRDDLEDAGEAGPGRAGARDERAGAAPSRRRRPEREASPARATRARRDPDARDAAAGDPEEGEEPDSPPEEWIASGLEGLRATRDEPEQIEMDTFEVEPDEVRPAGNADRAEDPAESREPAQEPLVVILTVLAPPGERLDGAALRGALESQALRHGEDRLFHLYPDAGPPGAGPLFSAVNVVEPGVFDLETMDSLRTPGIGLFMRLPGPEDPGAAFGVMVDAARELADALDAQLCDETRSKLTAQTLNHLREQIADHGRRRLLRA